MQTKIAKNPGRIDDGSSTLRRNMAANFLQEQPGPTIDNLISQTRARGDCPAGAVISSLNVMHQAVPVVTVPFAIHLVPLAGFTGLMVVAACEDVRRLVIPNGLVIALCLLWPVHLALAPRLTLAVGGLASGCAAAVF